MCSQFTIRTTEKQIRNEIEELQINFKDKSNRTFDSLIVPHSTLAPIITQSGLKMMSYSLIPSWSKEKKLKFATHNARLFSEDHKTAIYQKPTWKIPFQKNHCIVPISEFIEPIYIGKFAGNMVKFGIDNKLLFAAGIYDHWVDKKSGEITESFAIITDNPPPFIQNMGHDRCPIFLNKLALKTWINNDPKSEHEWISLLQTEVLQAEFNVSIHRPMVKGWEKRIPT